MKTPRELSDFVVIGNLPPNAIKSPSFLTSGAFGKAVFKAYEQERATTYQDNPNLKLQLWEGVVNGSSFFDNFLINKIIQQVQGNPRTASLLDLSNSEILRMVEGEHYVDARALVLRSSEDPIYTKNNSLISTLIKHVER